ncbi:MAG TPA: UDP-N-acetylmuramoyl-L-alanine--D-glutamate ligase [Polyangiales bacterium]|nr:UDP-N-acetylmuramoyl-L-alanine--D-glutamate ligase [Polyangiales bacterium]
MELTGTRVTVVGLGQSGLAVVRLLIRKGARVTVNDGRRELELGAEAEKLGATLSLGDHEPARFADAQLIVVSPGVPALPAFADAGRRGIPVVSEIELASWFISAPIVGITGTNGKSTVTTLIGKMCEASGKPTFTGGNLGTPLSVAVDSEAAEHGYVVAELSSFQLERVEKFHAKVGVLLNVTDDHLDRYENLAAYAAAKGRLFTTQHQDGFAIAPAGDQLSLSLAYASPGKLVTYAGVDGEVRRQGDAIVDTVSGLTLPIAELGIRGEHNLDNACAAALAARLLGIDAAVIAEVLRSFKGLPHRMQQVATLEGVDYFDDSKATNVGASIAALAGFARAKTKVVLIAGGVDKGGSYEPLRTALEKTGAGLVLIGAAGALIAKAFEGSTLPIAHAKTMADAVAAAHKLARFGEAVLLAPACSSFDMFKSYAHRGDVFRDAVLALQASVQEGQAR